MTEVFSKNILRKQFITREDENTKLKFDTKFICSKRKKKRINVKEHKPNSIVFLDFMENTKFEVSKLNRKLSIVLETLVENHKRDVKSSPFIIPKIKDDKRRKRKLLIKELKKKDVQLQELNQLQSKGKKRRKLRTFKNKVKKKNEKNIKLPVFKRPSLLNFWEPKKRKKKINTQRKLKLKEKNERVFRRLYKIPPKQKFLMAIQDQPICPKLFNEEPIEDEISKIPSKQKESAFSQFSFERLETIFNDNNCCHLDLDDDMVSKPAKISPFSKLRKRIWINDRLNEIEAKMKEKLDHSEANKKKFLILQEQAERQKKLLYLVTLISKLSKFKELIVQNQKKKEYAEKVKNSVKLKNLLVLHLKERRKQNYLNAIKKFKNQFHFYKLWTKTKERKEGIECIKEFLNYMKSSQGIQLVVTRFMNSVKLTQKLIIRHQNTQKTLIHLNILKWTIQEAKMIVENFEEVKKIVMEIEPKVGTHENSSKKSKNNKQLKHKLKKEKSRLFTVLTNRSQPKKKKSIAQSKRNKKKEKKEKKKKLLEPKRKGGSFSFLITSFDYKMRVLKRYFLKQKKKKNYENLIFAGYFGSNSMKQEKKKDAIVLSNEFIGDLTKQGFISQKNKEIELRNALISDTVDAKVLNQDQILEMQRQNDSEISKSFKQLDLVFGKFVMDQHKALFDSMKLRIEEVCKRRKIDLFDY